MYYDVVLFRSRGGKSIWTSTKHIVSVGPTGYRTFLKKDLGYLEPSSSVGSFTTARPRLRGVSRIWIRGGFPVHGPKGRAGGERGVGVSPLPLGGSGGPPPGNFLKNWIKMVHSGYYLDAIVTSLNNSFLS